MKYYSKFILCTLIGTIAVVGCDTKELHELNINPQALNQVNLNFLLTNSEMGSASGGDAGDDRYIDWRTNINMCSFAIQQLATTGTPAGEKYTENGGSTFETNDAPFEFLYGTTLKNLTEIIKQTGPGGYDDGKKVNLRQIARIMRAFLFSRLTDYYGSIPYFNALQANSGGTFFPGYDKQKDVYADLLKELDEASGLLSIANPDDGLAVADIIYGGQPSMHDAEIGNWKKFGYSIMLRLAMRISNVDPASAASYVSKAVAGGVFTSNTENAFVPMALGPSEWSNQNGISRAFYPGDGGVGNEAHLSKTLVDYMKGPNTGSVADDDPRLMVISGGIATWTPTTWTVIDGDPLNQKGMPNGYDQTGLNLFEGHAVNVQAEYSKVNFLMMQDDEPYMLMNYGEVELLLAEAANRGIGGVTGAAVHYANGVKASMQMYTLYDASLTVSDAAVATYLTTYVFGVNSPKGAATELEMIAEQYWVNHFLNWWEAWSNWRRTGLPVLVPANYPGNVTGGTIPVRLRYPNAEVSGNPNFEAGSTKPNVWTTKVWWAGGSE